MWGILCVQFLDVCVKFWKKKRQSFENVLAREKNPCINKTEKSKARKSIK